MKKTEKNSLSNNFSVRLSDEQLEIIDRVANRDSATRGNALRRMIKVYGEMLDKRKYKNAKSKEASTVIQAG